MRLINKVIVIIAIIIAIAAAITLFTIPIYTEPVDTGEPPDPSLIGTWKYLSYTFVFREDGKVESPWGTWGYSTAGNDTLYVATLVAHYELTLTTLRIECSEPLFLGSFPEGYVLLSKVV